MKKDTIFVRILSCLIILGTLIYCVYKEKNIITTSSSIENFTNINNQKICWGIKRVANHEQPDIGSKNKKIMEEYGGLCMGGIESKNVYLTFDAGYEAGYTEKILDVLKDNNVTATFFITAHYLNTQPDLVKRMIDEGHIVGNHIPSFLMSEIYKNIK